MRKPGAPSAPPAAKKKSNAGMIIFAVVGSIGLVCCGGISYGAYSVYSFFTRVKTAVVDAFEKEKERLKAEADKRAKPGALDLTYVSKDFNGAFVVHPRRIYDSKLLAPLPRDMFVDEMIKKDRIPDPRMFERVVMLTDPYPGGGRAGDGPMPECVSVKGGFAARFPSAPATHLTFFMSSPITLTGPTLNLVDRGIEFKISSGQPHNSVVGQGPEKVYQQYVGKAFGAAPKLSTVKVGDLEGREADWTEPNFDKTQPPRHITQRGFLVGDKMYLVRVMRKADDPNEARCKEFLDSFRLLKPEEIDTPDGKTPPPFPDVPAFPGFVLTFNVDMDMDKLTKMFFERYKTRGKKFESHQYIVCAEADSDGMPMTICMIDPRTWIVAPESMLLKMLKGETESSPLRDRLKDTNIDADIVGVVVTNDTIKAAAKEAGTPFIPMLGDKYADAATLPDDVSAASLRIDLASEKLLKIDVEAASPEAAARLEKLANSGLGDVRGLVIGSLLAPIPGFPPTLETPFKM